MDYHIYHLFPKLLNLYGDRGNIICLSYFAKQLGLNPIIHEIVDVEDINWDEVDFILIGGGSDREQGIVTKELTKIKEKLKQEVDNGLPLLAVCGGYQFLGHYYQDTQGNRLDGLSILDMTTIGQTKTRMIGNVVLDTKLFGQLVGFENHAGESFHEYDSIGDVVVGYGDNLVSKREGIQYQNLIGTYLHGPLLPKNPEISLFFLKAHAKRRNLDLDFDKIDLSLEKKTKEQLIKKYMK